MKNKSYVGIIIRACLIVSIFVLGFCTIGDDMYALIKWYASLLILGFSVLPIVLFLFKDGGGFSYVFAKVIGLCIGSYLVWLLSSLRLVTFSRAGIFAVLLITYVISWALYYRYVLRNKDKCTDSAYALTGFVSVRTALSCELALIAAFLLITILMGCKIPATETERLMDYAFMKSIYKCDYFPPLDSFAAGESINYYYFGHYMMTYLCIFAGVNVSIGYTLALNMIFALSLIMVYCLSSMILNGMNVDARGRAAGGIISALAVCIAGNGHYIVFCKIVPMLQGMLGIESDKKYWFADSTRYIGYTPVVENDRTISEFPSYSFLVGDLHAHVIDIIVVITILSLLYLFLMNTKDRRLDEEKMILHRVAVEIFNPYLIIIAFMIGICSMTNYWDFIIYFTILSIVILASTIYRSDRITRIAWLTITKVIISYLIVNAVNVLFMSSFDKMFDGIGIVDHHTMLHQLIIMWGIPIATVIIYMFVLFNKDDCLGIRNGDNKFFMNIIMPDLYCLCLSLCAIGLVFVPECIFVKDIYYASYPRANTMFKLTYQAFIIFGILIGIIFVRVLGRLKGVQKDLRLHRIKTSLTVVFVLFITTLFYFVTASLMWFGEPYSLSYKGIASDTTILKNMGDEAEVVAWIDDNITGDEVILTSDGLSYTDYCVIPALTGHPTVIGWQTHEWLWHNSYEYVSERQKDVSILYTGLSQADRLKLIDKYDISYIYVGAKEREKYSDLQIDMILECGDLVYTRDNGYYFLVKVAE